MSKSIKKCREKGSKRLGRDRSNTIPDQIPYLVSCETSLNLRFSIFAFFLVILMYFKYLGLVRGGRGGGGRNRS